MINPFLRIAITRAAGFARKPGRMIHLVARMIHRMHNLDRSYSTFKEFRNQIHTLGRLVVSYAHGHYHSIPTKTLIVMIAAILYFLNPFDLVPDAILGAGFMDDLAVIAWVYRTSQQQIDQFIQWEKSRITYDTK